MAESPIIFAQQLVYVGVWLALFVPASLFFCGLLSRFTDLPRDVSWALGKILGFFGFAWIIAAPASAGLYQLNDEWIRWAFVLFCGLGLLLVVLPRRKSAGTVFSNLGDILGPELLFVAIYLAFTFIWSLHCILGSGEKVMNFTFLNFFIHNDSLPPQDPWAAGIRMQYYYFGSFVHALWHRIGEIPSAVGYGLAVATDAAGLALALYAIFRLAGLKRFRSWISSAICLFAGNAQTIWSLLIDDAKVNSQLFWKSSRVFSSGHFSEFPLWTYLFADLHAHNIGLFLGLTATFFLFALLRASDRASAWTLAVMLGLSAGMTPISNTWDVFMVLTIFIAIVLTEPRRVLAVFPQLLLAGVVALAVVAPFIPSIIGPKPIKIGILKGEWVTIGQVLLFLGFPIALVVLGSLTRLRKDVSWLRVAVATIIFGAMMYGAYTFHYRIGNPFSNYHIAAQGLAALLVSCAITVTSVPSLARQLLLASAILIYGMEFVVVFDRTITLFKIYFQLSALFWLAGLIWLSEGRAWLDRLSKALQVSVICLSLVSGFLLIRSIVPNFPNRLHGMNLDGVRAILLSERDIGRLLQWMSRNITGFPTILDAWGAGGLGRVTLHLGFPDFAHWEAHTVRRGVPHAELIRRKNLINEFYTTEDSERAYQILRDNNLDYFVVSKTERRTYPEKGLSRSLQKFDDHPELFTLIHREGGAALYAPVEK